MSKTCTPAACTGLSTHSQGQPTPLRRQLAGLPWRQGDTAHRATTTAHGRREIRTLKVVTIAAGIEFPHATQAIQITRKTRPVHAGKTGKWHTETVYAITDLAPHRARPDELPPGSAGTGRSRTPCTGYGT